MAGEDVPMSAPNNNFCKRCNRPTQSGFKCTVCGVISHPGCVKLMKNVKVLSDDEIICCSSEKPQKSTAIVESVSNESDTSEIFYLKELLRHKDSIIENQADLINSLKDQISLLKNVKGNNFPPIATPSGETKSSPTLANVVKSGQHGIRAGSSTSLQKTAAKGKHTPTNGSTYPTGTTRSNPGQSSSRIVTTADVHEALTRMKCDDIINLEPESEKKRTRFVARDPIIGEKPVDNNSKLRPAVSYNHWHVYRLHPDTTTKDLEDFLRSGYDFSEIRVEKLQSRNPEAYSSFKLTVQEKDSQRIRDPKLWPSGARINRFFLPRDK